LPELTKGKGNKLISLPKGIKVTAVFAFEKGQKIELVANKYSKSFGLTALEEAFSARTKKGIVLPRTLKNVTEIRLDK
jgi:topoisomerase-4 subunit A